ncbi:MAG: PspC domain-containing protein [Desulfitobacteriaceae bacterium]
MTDRLYRSGSNKMLGGVCGGLAEYFNIDATLVRLIALVAMFAGGVGFLAYFAGWIIIPMDPAYRTSSLQRPTAGNFSEEIRANVDDIKTDIHDAARNFRLERHNGHGAKLAGIVLIGLGIMFFLDRWFPLWFSMDKMWPLVLIIIGIVIVFRGERK